MEDQDDFPGEFSEWLAQNYADARYLIALLELLKQTLDTMDSCPSRSDPIDMMSALKLMSKISNTIRARLHVCQLGMLWIGSFPTLMEARFPSPSISSSKQTQGAAPQADGEVWIKLLS